MKPALTDLRVFVAVANTGHFTRAAEQLGMSQSALSAALGKLEKMLGTRLVDRHTRASRLTEAGLALLAPAQRLVQDWDHLLGSAQDFASFAKGRVSIAAPSAQCALLLPPLIRQFGQLHPGVRVTVHDVAEQEVHELVRSGAADLGVATDTGVRTDLLVTPFYSDQYIAVLPPGHALERRRSLEWSQLAKEPMIGPLPGNPVRRHLDERLALQGLRLDYRHEVSLPWTMVGLVREGLGVSVLTMAVRPLIEWHQLAIRPINRPSIARTLVLLRLQGRVLSPSRLLKYPLRRRNATLGGFVFSDFRFAF